MKKFLNVACLVLILGGLVAGIYFVDRNQKQSTKTGSQKSTSEPKTTDKKTYDSTNAFITQTEIFGSNSGQVTRMKITPDGETMLAATLQGDIFAYSKKNGEFVKQETKFFSVDTNLKGYPTQNGLTGMTFAADFATSKEIFLSYTFKNDKDELKNRVGRITLSSNNGVVTSANFEMIFEGNVNASSAHQIQGGVGVMINGVSHYMFPIGDAFEATNAHDLTKDAGKIFLIQRDGTNPVGQRPFIENPKVQAVGIRNVYDIELDPYDPQLRYMFIDTGNNDNDKLVFGKLVSTDGLNTKQIDLKWTGSDDDQKLAIPDLYTTGTPNMNLFQWSPTQTPLDIEFINFRPGSTTTPGANESYFLLTVFGKTGSTENAPGKKVLFGKLTGLDTQPQISFEELATKNSNGEGFLSNPTAITVDQLTKSIYFSDIMESRIYKIGNLTNLTLETP